MASQTMLTVDKQQQVALVTLRRPQKRNALSIELRRELASAFGELSGDDEIGCVVLTGAGSAFCSGMDTTQFGGDRANRELLVETSTRSLRGGRRLQAAGDRGCERPRPGRWIRPLPVV